MIKYFKLLFKKHYIETILLVAALSLTYLLIVLNSTYSSYNYHPGAYNFPLSFLIVAICVLSFVFVFIRFSFLKNKKEIDLYYSLPIKRSHIILTQTLFGLVQLVGAYTIAYWVGFIVLLTRQNSFNLLPFLPFYFAFIPVIIVCFLSGIVIFLRANSVVDGILFVIMLIGLSYMLVLFITIKNPTFNNKNNNLLYLLEIHLIPAGIYNYFYTSINGLQLSQLIQKSEVGAVIGNIMLYAGGALGGYTATILTVNNEKTENIGRTSDFIIGYKALIPIYSLLIILLFNDLIISLVVSILFSFVMYVIYRRSAKFKLADYICIASSIILGIIFVSISRR
ncbi:MAG: hypothetical protein LBV51_01395 [Acholeplasmatales bacterium]|jgi:hypothetical protein|nr:hypothetical protein [Acholeplasmatales bacterium]